MDQVAALKQAIDTNNLTSVQALMTANPDLHRAPLGYGKDGPLTWLAECRVPWEPPSPTRLEMARWMIENGSDVHQGGDGPLARASLNSDRIAMMDLLFSYGADVNALWHGNWPVHSSPCEAVDPVTLKWLLDHGADPNRPPHMRALDYLIGTYVRCDEFKQCIDLLLAAGAVTRYDLPGVLPVLRGDLDALSREIDADPSLVHRRYPELDCGSTAARRLLLTNCTLLHVAAEYGETEAARLLLNRGADPNATGGSGETPVFHSASQNDDWGLDVTRLLIDRGANLKLKTKLPGHYEREDEIVERTPLGYALLFPGTQAETVQLLRERGAPE